MTCYAVIDTNVLVSALFAIHTDSATVQVVNKLFTKEIIPLYSTRILEEYSNVLHRKKFNFTSELVLKMLSSIKQKGICIDPHPTGEVLPDMKDLPFYEVVMEKQDDNAYLVTGNLKHFPQKPFIVTPREMLDIINNGQ